MSFPSRVFGESWLAGVYRTNKREFLWNERFDNLEDAQRQAIEAAITEANPATESWVSTYPLSHFRGRLTTAGSQLIRCLFFGGGSLPDTLLLHVES